jgi:integrase
MESVWDRNSKCVIDRELEILRRAFSLAASDAHRLVAWVPKVPTLMKANANARRGFLSRDDFTGILEKLDNSVTRDFLTWFYWTGMRPGEIASLRWQDYDKESGAITLAAADAKIGRARTTALFAELVPVIERRLADRRFDCPLIFHRVGKSVTSNSVLKHWHAARELAEVAAFVPYDLRRTAVKRMIAAGVPERVAMEISGHRTRAMFDRYNIVDERDLADAMVKRAAYKKTLTSDRRSANKIHEFPTQRADGK